MYYQNTHTYTHPHITKQYKTTTVQVKTNTVHNIPKWNSHKIIKYPQYKVTLMYMALLSPRTSPEQKNFTFDGTILLPVATDTNLAYVVGDFSTIHEASQFGSACQEKQ